MNRNTIRVLMISARADFGGGPEHVYRLLESLKEKAELFAAIPEDIPYYERICGLIGKEHVVAIPHRRFSFIYLLKIISFIFKKKINVVHSHGKGAGVYSRPAAFFTFSYCVHSFHGIHTGKYSRPAALLYRLYERLLSLITNQFIATGDGERNEALKAGLAPRKKISLVHNGVVIPGIQAAFPTGGEFNIITVTRFDEAKNPGLILPILQSLRGHYPDKKVKLIIVGSGPGSQETASDISLAGLNDMVEFTGSLSSVTDVYLRSFCYLSTSKMEGLPLSVLEALSFGLPCVVTDVPGNNDLIKPGLNGFLYGLHDPSQAADNIARLMTDENLWNIYSKNAATMIQQHYSTEQMGEKVLALYASLTGSAH